MGPEALIALAALGAGISGAGVKALFQIAKSLGKFEATITEILTHHEHRLDRLDEVTDRHDERLRMGKL